MPTSYYDHAGITIYCGDCLGVMRTMNENSVDSIVTDPPYGLTQNKRGGSGEASLNLTSPAGRSRVTTGGGFMGQQWDATTPCIEVWQEAIRVAKPGAHLLAFGGTRTFHRLACAIEDAGWEIRDCVMWVYGSGFPKSLDVSKAIDKAAGASKNKDKEIAAYLKERRESLGLSKAYVDAQVFGGSTRYAFVEGRNDATGSGRIYLPTPSEWKTLKGVLRLDHRYDDYISAAIPERNMRHRADGGKAELIGKADGDWGYQQDGERWNGEQRITAPATDAAKQWFGWGTALKPAWEPIVVARKPLIGTVAANVLEHGTGAMNIDGCRVKTSENLSGGAYCGGNRPNSAMGCTGKVGGTSSMLEAGSERLSQSQYKQPAGRWPANMIHDGSEEVVDLFPQSSGKGGDSSGQTALGQGSGWNKHNNRMTAIERRNDAGSASRFFYCAKASKSDRGKGNNHPTVKPVALMRYLCNLITPPGGVVLDPFMGSGSTGKAARADGFCFIGIEAERDYCEIAVKRLGHEELYPAEVTDARDHK